MRVFIGRAAGLALVLAMCVVGCGGDDSEAIHEVDASRPDAPLPVDAGAHVSVDAGESTVKGGAGRIEITPNGVVAGFSPEFTPLHFAEAPHCVVHVKPIGASGETVFRAGTLRLAGPVVGTPGAMPAPVVVPIVSRDYYLYTAGPVVGATDAYLVEVSLSGNSRLPPMAVQSLRPAAAEPITLLQPAAFGGVITARATEDFEVAWTVPTAPHPEHRVVLAITALTSRPTGAPLTAAVDLLCGFPLDDGRGTVPASVLAKVGELLGGLPVGGGRFFVGAGDWKEFTGNDASYVIEVSRRFESTQPPYTLTGFAIE